jgi:hypothetical protein
VTWKRRAHRRITHTPSGNGNPQDPEPLRTNPVGGSGLNPAEIARRITNLQTRLLVLAKDKTEQLHLATIPTALPEVRKGTHFQAS